MIDLRPTIEGLLRYWWLIVGITVVIVALAIIASLMLPERYEATALVAITEPTQRLQFDERFETVVEESPLLKSYPELATSDELVGELLKQLPSELRLVAIPDLRGLLAAESGTDPGLVRLIVRHEDPETAALIANAWGELFVEWANLLYGNGSSRQVAFFENQLAEAQTSLETAEQNLINFQDQNRLVLVENEVAALTELQQAYLEDQQTLMFTLSDVKALRSQLQASNGSSMTLADQLTALTLQAKAFGAVSEVPLPVQLQLDGAGVALTGASRAEQLDLLDNLAITLESGLTEIEANLAALEPQMLEKQRVYQEIVTESDRLLRDRDVAEETYLSLARKVDEERILAQDVSGGVRLASGAAVPVNPSGPGLIISVFVAGAIGLGLGMGVALLLVWWRRARSAERQLERERLNARTT
jgi:GumC protein